MRKILAIDDSKTIRLAIKITFAAEDAEAAGSIPGGGAHGRAGAAEAARRGTLALERYCWLVFFAAYCLEEGPGDFRRRFTAWSRARWRARPRARDMVLR